MSDMSDKIKKNIAHKRMMLSIFFCMYFTIWGLFKTISKNQDMFTSILSVAIYAFCGFFGFDLAYEKMDELLYDKMEETPWKFGFEEDSEED